VPNTFRTTITVLVIIVGAGCQASYPTQPTTVPSTALFVHSGVLEPVEITGNASAFQAYALDADGAWHIVTASATWTSSDAGIGRLAAPGRFTPVSPGSVTITARYDGVEATANMVVIENSRSATPQYPRLELSPSINATVGGTGFVDSSYQETVNSGRTGVRTSTNWSSDDPRVATIDANGLVKGLAIGRTVIRAEYRGATNWFYLSLAPK